MGKEKEEQLSRQKSKTYLKNLTKTRKSATQKAMGNMAETTLEKLAGASPLKTTLRTLCGLYPKSNAML